MIKNEATTPKLYFNKMNYLISDEKFCEIEFLGHVFCFPIAEFTESDFESHVYSSMLAKNKLFNGVRLINNLSDIDLTLKVLSD